MAEKPQRNWLHIISPCLIAMLLSIFGIIDGAVSLNGTGGWSGIVIIISILFLGVIVIIDVIVRLIVGKRTGLLWLLEIVLLVVTVIIFRSRFW